MPTLDGELLAIAGSPHGEEVGFTARSLDGALIVAWRRGADGSESWEGEPGTVWMARQALIEGTWLDAPPWDGVVLPGGGDQGRSGPDVLAAAVSSLPPGTFTVETRGMGQFGAPDARGRQVHAALLGG